MNNTTTNTSLGQTIKITLNPKPGFVVKSIVETGTIYTLSSSSSSSQSQFSHSTNQDTNTNSTTNGPGRTLLEPPNPDVTNAQTIPIPKGTKIFINIAWDINVPPPPSDVPESEIRKAMMGDVADDYDVYSYDHLKEGQYYVPIVVSEPRGDLDKSGKSSIVFDCILNPRIKPRTAKDIEFRTYIIELSLERIESKSRLSLSRQIGTPNIAVKGTLGERIVSVPLGLFVRGGVDVLALKGVIHGEESGDADGVGGGVGGGKKLIEEVGGDSGGEIVEKGKGMEKQKEKEKEKILKSAMKKPSSSPSPSTASQSQTQQQEGKQNSKTSNINPKPSLIQELIANENENDTSTPSSTSSSNTDTNNVARTRTPKWTWKFISDKFEEKQDGDGDGKGTESKSKINNRKIELTIEVPLLIAPLKHAITPASASTPTLDIEPLRLIFHAFTNTNANANTSSPESKVETYHLDINLDISDAEAVAMSGSGVSVGAGVDVKEIADTNTSSSEDNNNKNNASALNDGGNNFDDDGYELEMRRLNMQRVFELKKVWREILKSKVSKGKVDVYANANANANADGYGDEGYYGLFDPVNARAKWIVDEKKVVVCL